MKLVNFKDYFDKRGQEVDESTRDAATGPYRMLYPASYTAPGKFVPSANNLPSGDEVAKTQGMTIVSPPDGGKIKNDPPPANVEVLPAGDSVKLSEPAKK